MAGVDNKISKEDAEMLEEANIIEQDDYDSAGDNIKLNPQARNEIFSGKRFATYLHLQSSDHSYLDEVTITKNGFKNWR